MHKIGCVKVLIILSCTDCTDVHGPAQTRSVQHVHEKLKNLGGVGGVICYYSGALGVEKPKQ